MDSLLIIFLYLMAPDWQLRQAMYLSKANSYEQSEIVLKSVKIENVDRDLYLFYRFLNNFRMNQKRDAEFYGEQIIDQNLPERYKVLTALMRSDIEHWTDEIDDIARDMQHVKDRLENLDGGAKTKKIQDDIVKRLSKMIEDKEKELEQSSQASASGSKDNQREPAKDSMIENTGGTGEVLANKMKRLQERWNSLPPRERSMALQEMTQGMSPRHREAIENYFRNLAAAKQR